MSGAGKVHCTVTDSVCTVSACISSDYIFETHRAQLCSQQPMYVRSCLVPQTLSFCCIHVTQGTQNDLVINYALYIQ